MEKATRSALRAEGRDGKHRNLGGARTRLTRLAKQVATRFEANGKLNRLFVGGLCLCECVCM